MSGAFHPRLAPLLAGGGTPERLATISGELLGRMERLLSVPLPRLLDDDILASLIVPPALGDTLEAALARLAGDAAETGAIAAGGSRQSGNAASPPLPADIAAHARAAARPAARVSTPRGGALPVVESRPPVAVANASEPAVGDRPLHLRPVAGRDWQGEAARLGANRPLNIAAEPMPPPASSSDPGSTEAFATSRRVGPVLASGDSAAAGLSAAPAAPWTGSAASSAESWGPTPIAAAGQQAASGPPPLTSTRRMRPIAAAAGAARDGSHIAAMAESAARRPGLRAVALPKGARVGGFAGLAALGRAAASAKLAPADPAPSPAPARTGEAAPPAAGASTTSADRPPPLEAKAVIAELADMLRLEVLAAGIDLSGRRS